MTGRAIGGSLVYGHTESNVNFFFLFTARRFRQREGTDLILGVSSSIWETRGKKKATGCDSTLFSRFVGLQTLSMPRVIDRLLATVRRTEKVDELPIQMHRRVATSEQDNKEKESKTWRGRKEGRFKRDVGERQRVETNFDDSLSALPPARRVALFSPARPRPRTSPPAAAPLPPRAPTSPQESELH